MNLLFCTYSIGIGGSDINHLADKDFLNFLKFRSPRNHSRRALRWASTFQIKCSECHFPIGRELDERWNIFIFIDSVTYLYNYFHWADDEQSRSIFTDIESNQWVVLILFSKRRNIQFRISRDIYLQNTSVHMLCFKNERISFI